MNFTINFSLLFILVFWTTIGSAQKSDSIGKAESSKDIIIQPIQDDPKFPEGIDALRCYLKSGINMENFLNQELNFALIIYIDSLGKPTNFIVKPIRTEAKPEKKLKEDLKVLVEEMPLWKPAEQQGRKINSAVSVLLNKKFFIKSSCTKE